MGVSPVAAQAVQYTTPSWWFGVAGAANLNQYRGTTQILNGDLTVPGAFFHGDGIGLFLAPTIEYRRPGSRWGFQLQAGLDSRKGEFDQILTPCNCPADLSTDLAYLTVEPSIRFAPFAGNFHLFGGPRFAFNRSKSFTYELGINPDFPDQEPTAPVTADFGNVNARLVSMQIGAGLDMPLNPDGGRTRYVLTPFVSLHPQWGQEPRSVNTWEVGTLRVGAAFKLGWGRREAAEQPVAVNRQPMPVAKPDPKVTFTVHSPGNVPVQRRVRETFPLRNYVFFDLGSTSIPDRYILLNKSEIAAFNEAQLETLTPKSLEGRSGREMVVYYNILNILGDRMRNNPGTAIQLVGSSELGPDDGMAMAVNVERYLVDIFGIDTARITTSGRYKPVIASEQPGATLELGMLRQDDRRVSIGSASPELLMEFQSGPDVPLKPVVIAGVQQAPIDSYITFEVDDAEADLASWSMEIRNDGAMLVHRGPYLTNRVSLPGASLLGSATTGRFNFVMIGTLPSGRTIRRDTTVTLTKWTPATDEEGMRYNILFEFNDSRAITLYQDYLTQIVAPKIADGALVVIHGHTDVIGNAANNQRLSTARAMDVHRLLEAAITQAGRRNVVFEVRGYGEDETMAPFENTLPEGRFYNRSVVIDIIPRK